MELNTSQPQHSQIISKPSRNPILFLAIGVIVIVLVALGLLVWQKNQEIGSMLNQLADTEKQLSDTLKFTSTKATDVPIDEMPMASRDQKEQQSAAVSAASQYYCALGNFDCDKVSVFKVDLQTVTDNRDGYAKVYAKSMSDQNVVVWLKYAVDGKQWVPFYEGEALPPADVVKKWSIPTDFLAVD
jgi:hypothetical protein